MTTPIRNRVFCNLISKPPCDNSIGSETATKDNRNTMCSSSGTQDVSLVLQRISLDSLVQDDQKFEDVHKSDEKNESIKFPSLSAQEELNRRDSGGKVCSSNIALVQVRRISVPSHRFAPLKKHWMELVEPIVKHMKLQIRMNVGRRCVELKMAPTTPEVAYLQKGADFVRSFMLGFEIQDGIALLRLDDLFLESFEIKDVKRLCGGNLSRAIGRISGKNGKTKHAIENSTRTRIVLADSHIHILGAFQNIKLARDAVCSLILGSPPGKVYNRLRTVSRRLQERL